MGASVDNLTVVVPFWNGHDTIGRLVDSLPAGLPVLIVDDQSDKPQESFNKPDVRVMRLEQRGYFSGAVNAGLANAVTDVLILNQDTWFEGDGWLERLESLRERYALIGDGVLNHPAWPKGYVQGTFMFVRRDAWDAVGPMNERDYPLWGSTCEWQLRACRAGFEALPSHEWRQWLRHEGRQGDKKRQRFGRAIQEAIRREPKKRWLFLRTPPAISVVVPCFNYGHYLADAVNSLIGGPTSLGEMPGQTMTSFEIVIVDDASTDDSFDVAQSLANDWKGIRAIRLPQNVGTAGALNAGVRAAHGKYIQVLSADDMLEPWTLQTHYRTCRKNPHSVAYGDITIVADGKRKRAFRLPAYDFEKLIYRNQMSAGIMYHRRAWEDAGGYPEAMRYGREDWTFNVALGIKGWCGVKASGEPGYLYRREKQNRSLRTGNVHEGEMGDSDFSWLAHFRDQIGRLFPDIYRGVRPVGCCGGRGSGRGGNSGNPAPAALPGNAGMVLLQYIGGNRGSATWWGPETGTRYRFGGNDQDRLGYVDARDADGMLEMRKGGRLVFQPGQQALEMPEPPAEAVEQANPG